MIITLEYIIKGKMLMCIYVYGLKLDTGQPGNTKLGGQSSYKLINMLAIACYSDFIKKFSDIYHFTLPRPGVTATVTRLMHFTLDIPVLLCVNHIEVLR